MNQRSFGRPAEALVLTELAERGPLASAQLQVRLGKSQPTVSRLLRGLGTQVVALGQGRATRYGKPQDILGLSAQQPIHFTDTDTNAGHTHRWGTLTLLAGPRAPLVHVAGAGREWLGEQLPWFMAGMRLQGFLGRAWARSDPLRHLGEDPTGWSVAQQLFALITTVHDVPGALGLGEPWWSDMPPHVPAAQTERLAIYDAMAREVQAHLPAHSSAEGEQPKWLAVVDDEAAPDRLRQVVVKYSPPRGTPFGERWHDLLHAEALAQATLRDAGEPAAEAAVLQSSQRTYLESSRFDRIGMGGRRHVVPLNAVHEAFVGNARLHWPATCEALATQRRLSAQDAQRVALWHAFGQLIGNSDMHFGNLSLFVDDIATERLSLAPCYDMLPMKYKPEPHTGGFDLQPLMPERPRYLSADIWQSARHLAALYWGRVSEHAPCSAEFRSLARTNAERVAAL
jgi:hypothetical protein